MVGRIAPLVMVAACGRLGFEAEPSSDAATDGDLGAEKTLRALCQFTKLTVIENGLSVDDLAGDRTADALAAGCTSSPSRRAVSQDSPGILDPVTDRPLLPADDLAVIGGGDGPHRAIAYLLEGDTPLVWSGGGASATIRERATDRVIAGGGVSAQHDYAFIMLVVEPIGGGRILSVQGFTAAGTEVAGDWFAREVAPTIASNRDAWIVIEWDDSDGVAGPSSADTYSVLESGG